MLTIYIKTIIFSHFRQGNLLSSSKSELIHVGLYRLLQLDIEFNKFNFTIRLIPHNHLSELTDFKVAISHSGTNSQTV